MSGWDNFAYAALRRLSLVFDNVSHSLCAIDYPHHEIHEGDAYYIQNVFDVPAGDVVEFRLMVGSSAKRPHLQVFFQPQGEFEWWFYEDVTINTAGTVATPINRDRNSSNTSLLTADNIANVDITAANVDTDITGATLIAHGKTGADKNTGGQGGTRHEIILKAGVSYSFRFQNKEILTQYIDGMLDWYEHTDSSWLTERVDAA